MSAIEDEDELVRKFNSSFSFDKDISKYRKQIFRNQSPKQPEPELEIPTKEVDQLRDFDEQKPNSPWT